VIPCNCVFWSWVFAHCGCGQCYQQDSVHGWTHPIRRQHWPQAHGAKTENTVNISTIILENLLSKLHFYFNSMNLTFRISPTDYLPDIAFCEIINIFLLRYTSPFLPRCGWNCLNIKFYLLKLNTCQLYFYIYFCHVRWGHTLLPGELQVWKSFNVAQTEDSPTLNAAHAYATAAVRGITDQYFVFSNFLLGRKNEHLW
jgi:hypothetical protein